MRDILIIRLMNHKCLYSRLGASRVRAFDYLTGIVEMNATSEAVEIAHLVYDLSGCDHEWMDMHVTRIRDQMAVRESGLVCGGCFSQRSEHVAHTTTCMQLAG